MWRSAIPATGTIAETYLRSRRGIGVPIPSTVRFLSPSKPEHHPAMLAPYGMPDEPEPGVLRIAEPTVSAIHLTLLKPDGSDKAPVEYPKITVGSPSGQPIVLAPPNDLLGLAVTEGIEDGFTVHQSTGFGVRAAGSGSYMPSLAETVPKWVECVSIFAHDDPSGRTGASGLAEALQKRGFEVRVEGLS